VYNAWPEIAESAFKSQVEPIQITDIDHVMFAGMGGSGALGDLFSAILSKTDIHVSVVKGYLPPRIINSNTLVVTTSISGNTEETINILDTACKQNCKTISLKIIF